jgi:methionyl-tRNA formyltransferase
MKPETSRSESGLRVVFVCPEEPSVMPLFFERVIPALRDEIAAIAVVSPIYKRSSWLRQAKQFAAAFGLWEFVVEAMGYVRYKVADVLPFGRRYSVKRIARAEGLRLLTPESVNGDDFLEELRGLEPDLVFSVSCPQIFGRELLSLPRSGCVNVHSALLPDYRGMLPTFWVLARGESHTGVTVHFMSPGIDGGEIIVQRRLPITEDETLHSLMRKCKATAAELILETVSRFREGAVTTTENPPDEGSYFSFPAREDVRRFKALGRALR